MTIKDRSITFPTRTTGKKWLMGHDPDPGLTVSARTYSAVRTRDGVRLPHYYKIIQDGGNATTNMNALWESVNYIRSRNVWVKASNPSFPAFTGYCEVDGDTALTNSWQNHNSFVSSLSTSFVDNLARARFYSALMKLQTQFQGMIFLGELKEALHMLRRPAAGLQNLVKDYLDHLKKRKVINPKQWRNELANAWLEQSFGWNPLLNDIKDAAKAWDRLAEKRETKIVSVGSSKAYERPDQYTFGDVPGAGIQMQGGVWYICKYCHARETHTIRYKGAVRAQAAGTVWREANLFGFSPQQFIPTAWELCPWSFLADYFANIGDILDSSVTSTRDVTYVNKTVILLTQKFWAARLDQVRTATQFGAGWTLSSYSGSDQPWSHIKRKQVIRTKDSGISIPDLQFNFSLSDGQLGNIAALLAQADAVHPQRRPFRSRQIWFPGK